MSQSDRRIQRQSVERLRLSSPAMIQVLTQDVIRQHIERIEPVTVSDLFALSETKLPSGISADIKAWAARAAREILDLPDGDVRGTFLAEVAEIPAALVPTTMRNAISALSTVSSADTLVLLDRLATSWTDVTPTPVVLAAPAPKPVQSGTVAHGATAAGTTKAAAAPKVKVIKTPAAMVDPRRAEWIREDAVARLSSREYAERGLKENIFVAGLRHRSPFKDLTDEEVKAELRRLERERKLKHTGERWMVR